MNQKKLSISDWGAIAAGVALTPVAVGFLIADLFIDEEKAARKNAKKATLKLWEEVKHLEQVALPEDIEIEVVGEALKEVVPETGLPHEDYFTDLIEMAEWVAVGDGLTELGDLEVDDAFYTTSDAIHCRNYLRLKKRMLADPRNITEWRSTLHLILKKMTYAMPPAMFHDVRGPNVPLASILNDPHQLVHEIVALILGTKGAPFTGMKEQIRRNFEEVNPRTPTWPNELKNMPAKDIVDGFLKGTPFGVYLDQGVPFSVPQSVRMEHTWCIGGTGAGKTSYFQSSLLDDFQLVAKGEASVIVIDSQADLIREITHLDLFGPGQPLDGRLCWINPRDFHYPPALNLFDVGIDRLNTYSPIDRERLINGIIELYDFVLGSLLGAELTSKQAIPFRYCVRLMLEIPHSTIHTFRELFEEGGFEKYREHTRNLSRTAQAFFENEFNHRQFNNTKREVLRRLYGVLENQTFERMFSNPVNKLNLFSEMNQGKVIVIDTAKDLLKEEGCQVFGRFFIALIAQAAQERATVSQRLPCFVYIDEVGDYVDNRVAQILEQARKYNIGMTMANQYVGQIPANVIQSFEANTATKMASGVSFRDAKTLAPMMKCRPEFIDAQPKLTFATHVRNVTSSAMALTFQPLPMENRPHLSPEDHLRLVNQNRGKYSVLGLDEPTQPHSQPKGRTYTPDRRTLPYDEDDTKPKPW